MESSTTFDVRKKSQTHDAWNYIKASNAPTETERGQHMLLHRLFIPFMFMEVKSVVFSDCCFEFDFKLNYIT